MIKFKCAPFKGPRDYVGDALQLQREQERSQRLPVPLLSRAGDVLCQQYPAPELPDRWHGVPAAIRSLTAHSNTSGSTAGHASTCSGVWKPSKAASQCLKGVLQVHAPAVPNSPQACTALGAQPTLGQCIQLWSAAAATVPLVHHPCCAPLAVPSLQPPTMACAPAADCRTALCCGANSLVGSAALAVQQQQTAQQEAAARLLQASLAVETARLNEPATHMRQWADAPPSAEDCPVPGLSPQLLSTCLPVTLEQITSHSHSVTTLPVPVGLKAHPARHTCVADLQELAIARALQTVSSTKTATAVSEHVQVHQAELTQADEAARGILQQALDTGNPALEDIAADLLTTLRAVPPQHSDHIHHTILEAVQAQATACGDRHHRSDILKAALSRRPLFAAPVRPPDAGTPDTEGCVPFTTADPLRQRLLSLCGQGSPGAGTGGQGVISGTGAAPQWQSYSMDDEILHEVLPGAGSNIFPTLPVTLLGAPDPWLSSTGVAASATGPGAHCGRMMVSALSAVGGGGQHYSVSSVGSELHLDWSLLPSRLQASAALGDGAGRGRGSGPAVHQIAPASEQFEVSTRLHAISMLPGVSECLPVSGPVTHQPTCSSVLPDVATMLQEVQGWCQQRAASQVLPCVYDAAVGPADGEVRRCAPPSGTAGYTHALAITPGVAFGDGHSGSQAVTSTAGVGRLLSCGQQQPEPQQDQKERVCDLSLVVRDTRPLGACLGPPTVQTQDVRHAAAELQAPQSCLLPSTASEHGGPHGDDATTQPVGDSPAQVASAHVTQQPVASGHVSQQPVVSGHVSQQQVVSGHVSRQQVVSGHVSQHQEASGHVSQQQVVSGHVSQHQEASGHVPLMVCAVAQPSTVSPSQHVQLQEHDSPRHSHQPAQCSHPVRSGPDSYRVADTTASPCTSAQALMDQHQTKAGEVSAPVASQLPSSGQPAASQQPPSQQQTASRQPPPEQSSQLELALGNASPQAVCTAQGTPHKAPSLVPTSSRPQEPPVGEAPRTLSGPLAATGTQAAAGGASAVTASSASAAVVGACNEDDPLALGTQDSAPLAKGVLTTSALCLPPATTITVEVDTATPAPASPAALLQMPLAEERGTAAALTIEVELPPSLLRALQALVAARQRLIKKLRQVPPDLMQVDQALLTSHPLDVAAAERSICCLQQEIRQGRGDTDHTQPLQQGHSSVHDTPPDATPQQTALIQVYCAVMVLSKTASLLVDCGVTVAWLYLKHMTDTMKGMAPMCASAFAVLSEAHSALQPQPAAGDPEQRALCRPQLPAGPDPLADSGPEEEHVSDPSDSTEEDEEGFREADLWVREGGVARWGQDTAAASDSLDTPRLTLDRDHPKYGVLLRLLQALERSSPGARVMVVGDSRMFFLVYRAVVAAGWQPHHLLRHQRAPSPAITSQPGATEAPDVASAVDVALEHSDCLLVDTAYLRDPHIPWHLFTAVIHFAPATMQHQPSASTATPLYHLCTQLPTGLAPPPAASAATALVVKQEHTVGHRPASAAATEEPSQKPQPSALCITGATVPPPETDQEQGPGQQSSTPLVLQVTLSSQPGGYQAVPVRAVGPTAAAVHSPMPQGGTSDLPHSSGTANAPSSPTPADNTTLRDTGFAMFSLAGAALVHVPPTTATAHARSDNEAPEAAWESPEAYAADADPAAYQPADQAEHDTVGPPQLAHSAPAQPQPSAAAWASNAAHARQDNGIATGDGVQLSTEFLQGATVGPETRDRGGVPAQGAAGIGQLMGMKRKRVTLLCPAPSVTTAVQQPPTLWDAAAGAATTCGLTTDQAGARAQQPTAPALAEPAGPTHTAAEEQYVAQHPVPDASTLQQDPQQPQDSTLPVDQPLPAAGRRQVVISNAPGSLLIQRGNLYQALLQRLEQQGVQPPTPTPAAPRHGPSAAPMVWETTAQAPGVLGPTAGVRASTSGASHSFTGRVEVELVERPLHLVDIVLTPGACVCLWPVNQPAAPAAQQAATAVAVMEEVVRRVVELGVAYSQVYIILEASDTLCASLLRLSHTLHTQPGLSGRVQLQFLTSGSPQTTQTLTLQLCHSVLQSTWFTTQTDPAIVQTGSHASPCSWHLRTHPVALLEEDPTPAEAFLTALPTLNPLSAAVLLDLHLPISQLLCAAADGSLQQLADTVVAGGRVPGYQLAAAGAVATIAVPGSQTQPTVLQQGWLLRCVPQHSLQLLQAHVTTSHLAVSVEDEFDDMAPKATNTLSSALVRGHRPPQIQAQTQAQGRRAGREHGGLVQPDSPALRAQVPVPAMQGFDLSPELSHRTHHQVAAHEQQGTWPRHQVATLQMDDLPWGGDMREGCSSSGHVAATWQLPDLPLSLPLPAGRQQQQVSGLPLLPAGLPTDRRNLASAGSNWVQLDAVPARMATQVRSGQASWASGATTGMASTILQPRRQGLKAAPTLASPALPGIPLRLGQGASGSRAVGLTASARGHKRAWAGLQPQAASLDALDPEYEMWGAPQLKLPRLDLLAEPAVSHSRSHTPSTPVDRYTPGLGGVVGTGDSPLGPLRPVTQGGRSGLAGTGPTSGDGRVDAGGRYALSEYQVSLSDTEEGDPDWAGAQGHVPYARRHHTLQQQGLERFQLQPQVSGAWGDEEGAVWQDMEGVEGQRWDEDLGWEDGGHRPGTAIAHQRAYRCRGMQHGGVPGAPQAVLPAQTLMGAVRGATPLANRPALSSHNTPSTLRHGLTRSDSMTAAASPGVVISAGTHPVNPAAALVQDLHRQRAWHNRAVPVPASQATPGPAGQGEQRFGQLMSRFTHGGRAQGPARDLGRQGHSGGRGSKGFGAYRRGKWRKA